MYTWVAVDQSICIQEHYSMLQFRLTTSSKLFNNQKQELVTNGRSLAIHYVAKFISIRSCKIKFTHQQYPMFLNSQCNHRIKLLGN